MIGRGRYRPALRFVWRHRHPVPRTADRCRAPMRRPDRCARGRRSDRFASLPLPTQHLRRHPQARPPIDRNPPPSTISREVSSTSRQANEPIAIDTAIETARLTGVAGGTRRIGDDPQCVLIAVDPQIDHGQEIARCFALFSKACRDCARRSALDRSPGSPRVPRRSYAPPSATRPRDSSRLR